MGNGQSKDKSIGRFLMILTGIGFASFLMVYNRMVLPYNSTILAFSYKYGFISRGLIGTIYQGIDALLPADMLNYEAVQTFTLIVTLLFFLFYFFFVRRILKCCPEEALTQTEYLLVFLTINVVTMFAYRRNFGRMDIYMLTLSMAGALCLLKKKGEWLVIPFAALGVMVHQGYVFMYFNILLVLLLYLILSEEGRQKKKYIAIFAAAFAVASVLFLWFEFFSHTNGELYVDEIIANAKAMTYKGKYHETLVEAEILGVDLTETEYPMHIENLIEFPVFLVLILPYLILGWKLFRGIISKAQTKKEKWKYRNLLLGAATLIPCYVLKVDNGRWTFAFVAYYVIILLLLVAMKDPLVTEELREMMARLKEKPWAVLLLLYPVLLLPFWDVHVDELMGRFSNPINETWLHLW